MRMVRTSRGIFGDLWDESCMTTSKAHRNRWRVGVWVDVMTWEPRGGFSTMGCPAWFLPWNRPMRPKKQEK